MWLHQNAYASRNMTRPLNHDANLSPRIFRASKLLDMPLKRVPIGAPTKKNCYASFHKIAFHGEFVTSAAFRDDLHKQGGRIRNEKASNKRSFAASLTASIEPHNSQSYTLVSMLRFALPVLGIYICSPLMSLVDTAFVGATSSSELAALSPATTMCDLTLFLFTFLGTATTGLVATAISRDSQKDVVEGVRVCLFVAAVFGVLLTGLLTGFTLPILSAFGVTGAVADAAATYVRVRCLALPLQLVAMVCNAAAIGVKDAISPLRITVFSALLNLAGDFALCHCLGLGIAGAAWATTFSLWAFQVLQIWMLRWKGLLPPLRKLVRPPSMAELGPMGAYVGPLSFVVLTRVVGFASMSAFSVSLGTAALGAHQIAFSLFSFFAVFGECLSQTAQTMLPGLMHGPMRSVPKARKAVNSLFGVACTLGGATGDLDLEPSS
ncbi:hypothetical protein CYMTET_43172 [Cymbomonas tetramitiformis]|uniref:Multidrug and toxic compound extrusion protein n=1 Tax=Cymbomonas tetramitiformis TaxID=36881 RepID=A0AAE0F0T9_9CHLO|nr:hypothetical protein CYMTET_43172 [Cymbomonas tetramitiformis]